MSDGYNENYIEWMRGQEMATVSFSQQGMISRIRKLKEERPDDVEIIAENEDGSICARITRKWIKINPTKILMEEQKEVCRRNVVNARNALMKKR